MLAFWSPGPWEMLVIGVIALLLYGGDLPRVARSWGKTLAEFRRGLSGIQNEINEAIYAEEDPAPKLEYHPEYHNAGGANDDDDGTPVVLDAENVSSNVAASADEIPGNEGGGEQTATESEYGFEDRAVTESADAERDRPRQNLDADVPSD